MGELLAELRARIDVHAAAAAVRRRPPVVTLAFIVVIASIWARLESGGQLPTIRFVEDGFSPRAILGGRYSVLLTSTLLTRDIFMVVSICISLLVTMGTYEVVAGHVRAVCLAVVAAGLAPLWIVAELGVLDALGNHWAAGRLETLDIGASAIVAASSGALAAIAKWRPLTVGLVLFLIGGLLLHHQLADWEHVSIFPCGYLFGRVFGAAKPRPRAPVRLAAGYSVAWISLLAIGLVMCSHVLPPNRVYRTSSGTVLSAPRIVQTSFPTPSMGGDRSVMVMLPAGYDSNPNKHYPVIELLHGDPGAPAGMISLGNLEAASSAAGVAPFIGVAPNGNDSTKPFSWWMNLPGHAMGTAITTDLRAWAAKQYRITSEWSFAGLSSGGYAAAYLPLISTQPVHGICAFSGYYNGRIPVTRKLGTKFENKISANLHARSEPDLVFVAYGASDKLTRGQSLQFVNALRKAHKHVIAKAYPGAHSWPVWRPAFQQCFQLLSPAQGNAGT